MNAIRRFFAPVNEPLRRVLYSLATALLAASVTFGVLTASESAALVGVVSAVLIVPATELARTRVTPNATESTQEPTPEPEPKPLEPGELDEAGDPIQSEGPVA